MITVSVYIEVKEVTGLCLASVQVVFAMPLFTVVKTVAGM